MSRANRPMVYKLCYAMVQLVRDSEMFWMWTECPSKGWDRVSQQRAVGKDPKQVRVTLGDCMGGTCIR